MNDFFAFRSMITPALIRGLFLFGAILCVLGGLGFTAVAKNPAGLVAAIVGPILLRIHCEILIHFFRINETLTEIKHQLEQRPK